MALRSVFVKDCALYLDGKKIATVKNVTIGPSPPTPRYIDATAVQTINLTGTYSSATPDIDELMRRLSENDGYHGDRAVIDQWKHNMGAALPPDFPAIATRDDPERRGHLLVSFVAADGRKLRWREAQAMIDGWPARRYAAHKARNKRLGWRMKHRAAGSKRRGGR